MTRDFRFSDNELLEAIKTYGAETMRGHLALHCLELREALRGVTTYLPYPGRSGHPTTMLERATQDARALLRRRS